MPFAFLAPLALAAMGLIAAPIVVHMLRRSKSHRLEFPSLRFLRETPSLVRRLTPPNRRWLLALRIAVIALLALAAARPVWIGGSEASGSTTVVLLDASASMARPDAREAARAAARDVIGRLGENDDVFVAQFDRRVQWLARGGSREEALSALASYAPGLVAGSPTAAVEVVEGTLVNSPHADRRIVLVSDFQGSNGPWPSKRDNPVAALATIRVDSALENAFLADALVETGPDGERLVASVVRAGSDGRSVERVVVPLVDGGAAEGLLVARNGETWTARVTAPDGFDADDSRAGVLGASGPAVVCDPGAGAPFLAAAVRVNEGDARVSVVSRLDESALAGASMAVVSSRALGVEGASAALESWVRRGGTALIFVASAWSAPSAFPGIVDVGASSATVSLSASPETSAAVAVRTSPLLVRPVEASAGGVVLARDGAGRPIAVRRQVEAGTVTVAGFDASPEAGRLVFDGGFPDVVRELLGASVAESREVGDVLGGLPDDAVVDVSGRRVTAEADGTVRLDAPGITRVTSAQGVRLIAVNVAAPESEPGQLTIEEVAAQAYPGPGSGASPSAALEASERRWTWWRVLLALALAVSIAELAVSGAARRRRTETAPMT